MRSISKAIGCKPPSDTWSPNYPKVCNTSENIEKHENLEKKIMGSERRIIINSTGCLMPCVYRDYQVIEECIEDPTPQAMGYVISRDLL